MGAMDDDGGTERGARRALVETNAELERREGLVQRLDSELAALTEQLRRSGDAAQVRAGDARRLLAGEQLRRRLKISLADLERRRREAYADVERARQRRQMLEEEIAAEGGNDDE